MNVSPCLYKHSLNTFRMRSLLKCPLNTYRIASLMNIKYLQDEKPQEIYLLNTYMRSLLKYLRIKYLQDEKPSEISTEHILRSLLKYPLNTGLQDEKPPEISTTYLQNEKPPEIASILMFVLYDIRAMTPEYNDIMNQMV